MPKRPRPQIPRWYAVVHAALVPLYPISAAIGIAAAIYQIGWEDGREKWHALVWVILVPLWLRSWWTHRTNRA